MQTILRISLFNIHINAIAPQFVYKKEHLPSRNKQPLKMLHIT